ncbi:MAG TPA: NADPH:quinone reductase [Terrimicrobiaceae bacterium]
MKAIRVEEFGEPDVMQFVEQPDPKVSGREILVRIHAVGVNPVDTYIRAGTYARKPQLPYTPGSDGAGLVAAVGRDAEGIKPGERVFLSGSISGTYAELALCAPEQVHALPDNITFAQGAALGIAHATAYRALFHRGQVRAGETVLVHGASGGVGTAAVQLALASEIRVIGTAGSPEGRDLVRDLGADQVFDHKVVGYQDAILDATSRRGVDCILEMLANVNLGDDLRLLAPCGRVVVIGSRGRVEIDARDAMMRDADIRGMILGNASPSDLAAIYKSLAELLAAGQIRPVVGLDFALAAAADAHRAVMAAGARGKIVLIP